MLRADTGSDATEQILYSWMVGGERIIRQANRFADAYVVPNYSALASLTSFRPAMNYTPNTEQAFHSSRDSAGLEVNSLASTFWVLYAATAFQSSVGSRDPDIAGGVYGFTWPNDESANLYVEALYDLGGVHGANGGFTYVAPYFLTHEIGHQFGLVPEFGDSHRPFRPDLWVENIMQPGMHVAPPAFAYFHPKEVATLRGRVMPNH